MRDYYEILHVSRDAPDAVIKASYRALMQKLKMHPDLGGSAELAARINTAYETLKDASKREDYDARLEQAAGDDSIDDTGGRCPFCSEPHALGATPAADSRCRVCESPLAPADRQRLERDDKRAVLRIRKAQTVDVLTAPPSLKALRCLTEDLSLNGVRLVSDSVLAAGQIVRLRCRQFDAVAKVVNQRSRRQGLSVQYVAGLSFLTIHLAQPRGGFVSDRA